MGKDHLFLLLLLCTCCSSSSSISWGGCPPEERSALLRLKQQLADPYDLLRSWKGLDCCSWLGIACHRVSGHVARLDLKTSFDYNPLSAAVKNSSSQIFPALFQLHHLEYLDLSWIDLFPLPFPSHDLPISLTRLTHLSLRGCGLTGQIPSEIGNMSTLAYLDISYNAHLEMRQSGSWIRNLRGLEVLYMYAVNITSTNVVENVASLTNLTRLWLSGVSGTTLSSLVNLTSLSHLYLCDSDVAHQPFPIWISNLTSLVSLELYNYTLHGSIPSTVLALPHLRNLALLYNPDLKVNLSSIVQHASQLTSLYIRSSNVGVIPNSIGHMSSLTQLDLSYNKIEGIIPPAIGNMSSLISLYLSYNKIEGIIPPTIENMSSLTSLYLSYNSLGGNIPWSSLCRLPKLLTLSLASNQLNGSLPSTISNLSSLERLSLNDNSLSGTFLLSQLDGLTKMQMLDLSNNLLTIDIHPNWIPKFQLQYLYLSSCNMHGDFPSFISTQYSISQIDLSNNSLRGNIPEWLLDLTVLGRLNLSYNNFEGALPSKFSEFDVHYVDLHRNKLQGYIHVPHPNVEFLDMSENQFEGINQKSTNKYTFSKLIYLSLANNRIKGVFPHSICEGPSLEVLDVSNNKFVGNLVASFGNCSSTLKVLNLEKNHFKGEIKSMVCLQTLKLGYNELQGPIPPSLQNCTSLQILDLGYNNMQGKIPNWLDKLFDLRILVLGSNKFMGKIPLQLAKLQHLQVLILSNNNLFGAIPNSLSNLKAMTNQTERTNILQFSNSTSKSYVDKMEIVNKGQDLEYEKSLAMVRCLDLSANNFSGNIPEGIGLLIGLKSLNLSRNYLGGKIPTSFGNLVKLESLDISRNNIIGDIPQELQFLTYLSYFDLSYNNLFGRIPVGGQFLTFSGTSFSNNVHLCGLQINKSCSSSISPNFTHNEGVIAEEWDDAWWEVGIGLSFGLGFAIVIAILCFQKKCRVHCFKIMDEIIFILDQNVPKIKF